MAISIVVALVLTVGVTPGSVSSKPQKRCPKHAHQIERHPAKYLGCEALGTGGGAARGDFNDDGFADLAIGSPLETVGSTTAAGAVHVVYGGVGGLSETVTQFFTESGNTSGRSESFDRFGAALASGDFDGDGFSDLAIGVPGEDIASRVAGVTDQGAVVVLYGSATGLDTLADFKEETAFGDANQSGRFGSALVWGQFGKGPAADLAIGSPFLDVGGVVDAGQVRVLYGRPQSGIDTGGLVPGAAQVLTQGGASVGDVAEANDRFGTTLAAADLVGTAEDDLVIGTPDEDVADAADAGTAQVVRGSATGLVPAGSLVLRQGAPETGDRFASAFAAADFNGAAVDLAVGSPGETVESGPELAGQVNVFSGTATGLSATSSQVLHAAIVGLVPQNAESFGAALAANDFDGNGADDLAIGIPRRDLPGPNFSTVFAAGMVTVVSGSETGINPATARHLQQNPFASGGTFRAELDDQFGSVLSAWDFGRGWKPTLPSACPRTGCRSVASLPATRDPSTSTTAAPPRRWRPSRSSPRRPAPWPMIPRCSTRSAGRSIRFSLSSRCGGHGTDHEQPPRGRDRPAPRDAGLSRRRSGGRSGTPGR